MNRPLIALIKPSTMFRVPDGIATADEHGSHYNEDEACWIVYDEYGNSYFEEDVKEVYENGLTSKEDVYDKVLYDYEFDNAELNYLYFDFNVKDVSKQDLLNVYTELQYDINGDMVVRVKKMLNFAQVTEFDNGTLNDLYTGNMKCFLLQLEKEDNSLCRFIDFSADENDMIIFAESAVFFCNYDHFEEEFSQYYKMEEKEL